MATSEAFEINRDKLTNPFQVRFFEQLNDVLQNNAELSKSLLLGILPAALQAAKETFDDSLLDAPRIRTSIKMRNKLYKHDTGREFTFENKKAMLRGILGRGDEPIIQQSINTAYAVFDNIGSQIEEGVLDALASGEKPFSDISGEEIPLKQVLPIGSHRDVLLKVLFKALEAMGYDLREVKAQLKQDWERSFLSGPQLDREIDRDRKFQERQQTAKDIRAKKLAEKEGRRIAQSPATGSSAVIQSVTAVPAVASNASVTFADCLSKKAKDILDEVAAGKGSQVTKILAQDIKVLMDAIDMHSPGEREVLRYLTSEKNIDRAQRGLEGEKNVLPPPLKAIAKHTKPSPQRLEVLLEEAPGLRDKLAVACPAVLVATAMNDHDGFNALMILHRQIFKLEDSHKIVPSATLTELQKESAAVLSRISGSTPNR